MISAFNLFETAFKEAIACWSALNRDVALAISRERRTFVPLTEIVQTLFNIHVKDQTKRDLFIKTVCETGRFLGRSTRVFARMGVDVITVEIDAGYYAMAGRYLDGLIEGVNIRRIHGDSPAVLREILPTLPGPLLVYLDAHTPHVPLLDELDSIASFSVRPVLVIHDFQTGTDLGHDGELYRLDVIRSRLDAIYGTGGWTHHFNSEATGARRGVLYVTPR